MSITMREVLNRLPTLGAAVRRELSQVVKETADAIVADARAAIEAPKSGRVYRRRGVTWRASAPGEAPARVTGTLARSVRAKRRNERTVDVTADDPHRLEYGSPGGKIAPRPYLRPAVARQRRAFEQRASRLRAWRG